MYEISYSAHLPFSEILGNYGYEEISVGKEGVLAFLYNQGIKIVVDTGEYFYKDSDDKIQVCCDITLNDEPVSAEEYKKFLEEISLDDFIPQILKVRNDRD